MPPRDDFAERARQEQIDRELDQALRNKYRDLNLNAEIMSRAFSQPDPDPTATHIGRLLVKALGTLPHAYRGTAAFSDVLEFANEVLRLDPSNASAFTFRALAYEGLDLLDQAIDDAQKAIALDPKAGAEMGVSLRHKLLNWQAAAPRKP